MLHKCLKRGTNILMVVCSRKSINVFYKSQSDVDTSFIFIDSHHWLNIIPKSKYKIQNILHSRQSFVPSSNIIYSHFIIAKQVCQWNNIFNVVFCLPTFNNMNTNQVVGMLWHELDTILHFNSKPSNENLYMHSEMVQRSKSNINQCEHTYAGYEILSLIC